MTDRITEYSDEDLYRLLFNDKETAEQAFKVIYARYSSRVYSYCLYFLGSSQDAKDVFQETFIKLHTSKNPNRQMTNMPGFLLKIARNLCLNYKRDSRSNNQVSYEDYFDVIAEEKSETKSREELNKIISQCVMKLPEIYREAFILKEYEGFSYIEICEVLEETMENVKIRLFRAKQKLRQMLEPQLKKLNETYY